MIPLISPGSPHLSYEFSGLKISVTTNQSSARQVAHTLLPFPTKDNAGAWSTTQDLLPVGIGSLVMKTTQLSSQSGSAFVEAAVVTPMLLMLIVSMMQFGYIYGVLANLRGASAVGARMAVLGTATSHYDVCQAARNAVTSIADTSQVLCQTSPSILPAPVNSPVTITLSYPVPILASNSGVLKGPTFTVSARTTMQ